MNETNKKFIELKRQFDLGQVHKKSKIYNELEDSVTFKHAVKILARKDYSRRKLSNKLKDRDCPKNEIEPVIDLLIEKNWFKEELYTEGRVKYLIRKGYHPNTIQSRLSEEDVHPDPEFIHNIMEDIQIRVEDQVHELIVKRLPLGEMPERLPDRVIRYLINRGHSFQSILAEYKSIRIKQ